MKPRFIANLPSLLPTMMGDTTPIIKKKIYTKEKRICKREVYTRKLVICWNRPVAGIYFKVASRKFVFESKGNFL